MSTEEVVEGTVLKCEFYYKPMANPVTIPASSANSVPLPWKRKNELLVNMVSKIELAEYNIGFMLLMEEEEHILMS